MYCAHCGAQMAEGARFCTACGTAVGQAPAMGPAAGLSAPPPVGPAGSTTQVPTGTFWQEGWKLPHGYRTDLQYVTLAVSVALFAEEIFSVLQGDLLAVLLNLAVAAGAAWASMAIRFVQTETARSISLVTGLLCAVFAVYDVVNHVTPHAPIVAAVSAGALLYTSMVVKNELTRV